MPAPSIPKILIDAIESRRLTLHVNHDQEYFQAYFEGNDSQFSELCRIESLEELNCDNSEITDTIFSSVKNLRNLRKLAFCDTAITGDAFHCLEELPILQEIVCNPQRDTSKAAVALAKVKSLHAINIDVSGFTDRDVWELMSLPVLDQLCLSQCAHVSDECCAGVSNSRISRIRLGSTNCGDIACSYLGKCDLLKEISLGSTKVTGEGIACLSQIPKLKSLLLSGNSLSSADIMRLGEQNSLESLYLWNTLVDDEVVNYLLELPSLQELNVIGTRISRDGIRRLNVKAWGYLNY